MTKSGNLVSFCGANLTYKCRVRRGIHMVADGDNNQSDTKVFKSKYKEDENKVTFQSTGMRRYLCKFESVEYSYLVYWNLARPPHNVCNQAQLLTYKYKHKQRRERILSID